MFLVFCTVVAILNALLLSFALYHLIKRGKFRDTAVEIWRIVIIALLIAIISADAYIVMQIT